MDAKEIASIIERAKTGDRQCKDRIIRLMQDNHYIKCINRYLYVNRLLEPDDVRSEFWLGVVLALPKVSTKIGDPLFYLSWCGANRVKSQLRKQINKHVQFFCRDCGYVGRLYRKNKEYQCRKCGSTNYETHQKEINLTTITGQQDEGDRDTHRGLEILIASKPGQLDVDVKLDYEYIKSKLAPKEREVITLIIERGIDREHERNYLKTIGEIMHVSAQCVNNYLRRVKRKMIHLQKEMGNGRR